MNKIAIADSKCFVCKYNRIPIICDATTADFMGKTIFHMFNHLPNLAITRLICTVQSKHSEFRDSLSTN